MNRYNKLIEEVRTIIDDVASGDENDVFDFELDSKFNYETLKNLISSEITEHVLHTLDDKNMSPEDNLALLISTMSYMAMQNFVLEYKLLTMNR